MYCTVHVIAMTCICTQFTVEKTRKELEDGNWYMTWSNSRTLVHMVDTSGKVGQI